MSKFGFQSNGQVLCAIDIHDFDQDVVELAALMASRLDAGLVLMYVTPLPSSSQVATPGNLGLSSMLEQDRQLLSGITPNRMDVPVTHQHRFGVPADQVRAYVTEHKPHLLVVGTHARRGLSRLLGSVATALLRQVSCPILVYRQRMNSQDFSQLKQEASQ